jgi:hypothetical protein
MPFSAIEKALIASKRLNIDRKCLKKTNTRPRSLNQIETPFAVWNASWPPKSTFCHSEQLKNADNFHIVLARQEMLIEHY